LLLSSEVNTASIVNAQLWLGAWTLTPPLCSPLSASLSGPWQDNWKTVGLMAQMQMHAEMNKNGAQKITITHKQL